MLIKLGLWRCESSRGHSVTNRGRESHCGGGRGGVLLLRMNAVHPSTLQKLVTVNESFPLSEMTFR